MEGLPGILEQLTSAADANVGTVGLCTGGAIFSERRRIEIVICIPEDQ